MESPQDVRDAIYHQQEMDEWEYQKKVKAEVGDTKEIEKALRYNEGKVQWSLVHFKSLEPMVRVLEFGAKKYAPNNWKKGLEKSKILESMQRHLAALIDGETHDQESGISHMGHIQCNAMFYNYFDKEHDA